MSKDKPQDLLLFRKFGRYACYVYCPSFCEQIFEWAANLGLTKREEKLKSNWGLISFIILFFQGGKAKFFKDSKKWDLQKWFEICSHWQWWWGIFICIMISSERIFVLVTLLQNLEALRKVFYWWKRKWTFWNTFCYLLGAKYFKSIAM